MDAIITPNTSSNSSLSACCSSSSSSSTDLYNAALDQSSKTHRCSSSDQLQGGRIDAGPYRLLLDRHLGRGAYGEVYHARCLTTGSQFAIKAMRAAVLTAGVRRQVEREVRMQARCAGHSGVLHMPPSYVARTATVPSGWYIILEYCDGGDLFSCITRGEFAGKTAAKGTSEALCLEAAARHVFLAVLDIVLWCHSQGVAHRDLKPENILLRRRTHWEIRLADFGLATDCQMSGEFGCGSVFYMSPECHPCAEARPYCPKACDVWSLGILLINLLRQLNPWRRAHPTDSGYKYYLSRPR
ncbi:kinase-like domain-containing protein, partial [Thamnocephalis sphaerospora]